MPALSKKQQKFMGIVRSIQKGEQPASKFNKDAQDVAKDMKKTDVKKFASTKHKGLPMKKEILGKLKEMIKQELSEYTYGSGDIVKDVNPTCPHYGAQGKVKSVGPKSVVFVVMNKGKNFKPGMELEKSHDQMKKIGESINEMSAKSKKIISKLGKKEKEMFSTMVDMLGFDQVMSDYKRDKKAFKQALADMSESVITEKFQTKSAKDYIDNLSQAIDLIVRQAQNLKGALAKHPIKRDANKLKAVKTMLKRSILPALSRYEKESTTTMSLKAVDLTDLKKRLQDGKFKHAIEYGLLPTLDTRSYDSNSFYGLSNTKEDKLREKLVKVLRDLVNKMDDAQLENINEDGHTDVASAKRKAMLVVDDANKLLNKLNGMNKEDSLPSWLSDKITLSQNYLSKATDYLTNPVESINENRDFEKLYNLFTKKDYFNLKNSIKTMLRNYDVALKKGDKGAQKYTKQDVIKSVTALNKENAKRVYDELVTAIKKKDIRRLKSRLRHNQPYSMAIFNQITGKKLPKTTRDIHSFLDNEFMKESVDESKTSDMMRNIRKGGTAGPWSLIVSKNNSIRRTVMVKNLKEIPAYIADLKKKFPNHKIGVEAKGGKIVHREALLTFGEAVDTKQGTEILNQLGGKRFMMFTGAKHFGVGKEGLSFKIGRNSKQVNHITIDYDRGRDLYNMKFDWVTIKGIKNKKTLKGVYADQLQRVFSMHTGMATKF